MTKHPSRKVMNFRHLLSCDTIVSVGVPDWPQAKTKYYYNGSRVLFFIDFQLSMA